MANVPVVGPQVELKPLPGSVQSPDASVESFGGGQSAAQVTNQAQGLTDQVSRYAQAEQDKMDAAAVLKAQGDLTRLKLDRMLNPDDGFLTKKGSDAAKSMPDYQTNFDKAAQGISDGLGNQSQVEMFGRVKQSMGLDFESDLKSHVAREAEKFKYDSANYSIQGAREDAAAHPDDSGKIEQSIARQLQAFDTIASGMPRSEYDATRQSIVSSTHGAVIDSLLNGGDDGVKAEAYLKDHAGEMTEVDRNKYHDQVQNALIPHWGAEIWNKVQGFRLIDGKPNEAKMTAYINGLKQFDDKTKARLDQYIKAMSGQDISNQARQAEARAYRFQQDLDKLFATDLDNTGHASSPALLANAMRMAERYSKPGDVAERDFFMGLATKKLGPDYHSNLDTKLKIFTGIQDGSTTSKDVQVALDKELLNPDDAYRAWMDLTKNTTKRFVPGMQGAYKIVDDMAKAQWGRKDQKAEYQQFMNTMLDSPAYKDRDPDAFVKLGQEGLKGRPTVWGPWYTAGLWGRQPEVSPTWKPEPGKALGSVGNIPAPGQEQGGDGYQGAPAGAPAIIGLSRYSEGQIAAARASLIKHGKAVTPEAQASVLAVHPDGVWP